MNRTFTLRLVLHILLWSVLITITYHHFILNLNPFLALVSSLVLLITIIVQLIRLRKRGMVYIGIFLTGLVVVTMLLSYVDEQLFSQTISRRYYGIVDRSD